MEMRAVADAAQLSRLRPELEGLAPHAVAAEHEACLGGRDFRTVFCLDADHAARRGAVKSGERAAQHLDALRRAQVEVGRLPLPVGHARRNAVGNEADAAHAEGRAGAEAARGDLQVLGVVLPVLHHDARHAAQALREVHLRPALADLLAVEAVDRGRDFQARLRLTRCRDDHDVVLRRAEHRHERKQDRGSPPLPHG